MTRTLQRAREVEPHRLGDCLEVAAFGQALHAVNADPGQVVTGLGDEGVAVRRLQVAEGLQWLPERKRQSGKSARNRSEHGHAALTQLCAARQPSRISG